VILLFSGLGSAGELARPDVASGGRGFGVGSGAGTAAGPGRSGEGWEIRARASSSRRVVRTSAPRRRGAEGRAAGRGCQRRSRSPGRSTTREVVPAALDSAVRIATGARARRYAGARARLRPLAPAGCTSTTSRGDDTGRRLPTDDAGRPTTDTGSIARASAVVDGATRPHPPTDELILGRFLSSKGRAWTPTWRHRDCEASFTDCRAADVVGLTRQTGLTDVGEHFLVQFQPPVAPGLIPLRPRPVGAVRPRRLVSVTDGRCNAWTCVRRPAKRVDRNGELDRHDRLSACRSA
jgi:hypothetical protein